MSVCRGGCSGTFKPEAAAARLSLDNLRDSQANVPKFIEPTRAFADLIVSGEEEVTNLVRELTNRITLEKQDSNTDNKDPISDGNSDQSVRHRYFVWARYSVVGRAP